MKRVIIVVICLIFMIFLSCEEQVLLVKCADCTEEEPVETALEVKVDLIIGSMLTGYVKIYEGNIDDSLLLGTYEINDLTWQHNVSVNKKYTLSATYKIGDATYVAIDSATPRVRYETKQCEKPCYYVYDNKVNLRIKYTR